MCQRCPGVAVVIEVQPYPPILRQIGKARTQLRAKVELRVEPPWQVTYHELYDVDPEHAERLGITVETHGMTVWGAYFGQDLLQIENRQVGYLLDVGWYPDGDPQGAYGLEIIPVDASGEQDWRHPVERFQTRSLSALKDRIHSWTCGRAGKSIADYQESK